jgi:hypothetical protein
MLHSGQGRHIFRDCSSRENDRRWGVNGWTLAGNNHAEIVPGAMNEAGRQEETDWVVVVTRVHWSTTDDFR